MNRPMSELIECIGSDRDPTIGALLDVAGRIWSDAALDRSASAWGQLAPGSDDRADAIRFALTAMRGSDRD